MELEARVHFHIPLHAPPGTPGSATTSDCRWARWDVCKPALNSRSHLEMETYTWGVLPRELKSRSVVNQLAAEYEWGVARSAEARPGVSWRRL